nr:hypothetical protein BCU51_24355 [Vibrio lentus]
MLNIVIMDMLFMMLWILELLSCPVTPLSMVLACLRIEVKTCSEASIVPVHLTKLLTFKLVNAKVPVNKWRGKA